MQLNFASLLRTGCCLLLLAGSALAGPLASDPAAMAGWHSTATFTSAKVSAKVDYAVYAPGVFSTSLALQDTGSLGFPTDPSGGADYVYAYEIFTTGLPSTGLLKLTVNVPDNAIPVGSNRIGDYSFAPELGLAPSGSAFNLTPDLLFVQNAVFTRATSFTANSHSDILFFTSAYPPEMLNAGVSGGGSNIAAGFLPAPIPEPATATLAGVAVACLFAGRFLRRRRA